jgi:hypothetical protein
VAIIIRQWVLDRARSKPRKPHDLHSGRADGGLNGAHVGHPGNPGTRISAQIPQPKTEKQQVNPLRQPRTANREPSQDGIAVVTTAPDGKTAMTSRTQSRLSLLDSTFRRIETSETPMQGRPMN